MLICSSPVMIGSIASSFASTAKVAGPVEGCSARPPPAAAAAAASEDGSIRGRCRGDGWVQGSALLLQGCRSPLPACSCRSWVQITPVRLSGASCRTRASAPAECLRVGSEADERPQVRTLLPQGRNTRQLCTGILEARGTCTAWLCLGLGQHFAQARHFLALISLGATKSSQRVKVDCLQEHSVSCASGCVSEGMYSRRRCSGTGWGCSAQLLGAAGVWRSDREL